MSFQFELNLTTYFIVFQSYYHIVLLQFMLDWSNFKVISRLNSVRLCRIRVILKSYINVLRFVLSYLQYSDIYFVFIFYYTYTIFNIYLLILCRFIKFTIIFDWFLF